MQCARRPICFQNRCGAFSAPELRLIHKSEALEIHAFHIILVIRIDRLLAREFLVKELNVIATLKPHR
jgi:hypothetical protein